MKKSKLSSLSVAAIATVAVTAGLAFAWFVTTEQSSGIDVSAGTIEMEVQGPAYTINQNMLPGESQVIGTAGQTIKNTGTREAIVRLNFGDAFKGYLTNRGVQIGLDAYHDKDDIVTSIGATGDYTDIRGTAAATNDRAYEINKTRLDAVAAATIDTTVNTAWRLCSDGNYYTRLEPAQSVAMTGLTITLKDELGGVVGQGAAESESRQYEQASQFELNYIIKAVQATNAAIADEFSPQVRDDLIGFGLLQ